MSRQLLADLDEDERRLIGPFLTVTHPSGNEYRGFCAECEDREVSKSPSASYNFIRGEWHCMKNDCGGTISKLMQKLLKREKDVHARNADVIDIKTGKKQPSVPLPTEKQIDGYIAQLHATPRLLQWMDERRGLDDVTLKRFRIGYDVAKKKFTIPVYAADGTLTNVRMYNHAAKGTVPKILPFATGYGTQLYNESALAVSDDVVLCEGEWDCEINEQHGIPTVTHTGGAGAFQIGWAIQFKGKHVFVCYDEDDGGMKGAIRTARMLRGIAAGVYIMTNMKTGKKSGDITDFYMDGGTGEQFHELMEEARLTPFALDDVNQPVATVGKPVSLEESQNAAHLGALELQILIAGKQTPPYYAPRKINARCDQGAGKKCALCPMQAYNGDRTVETSADDPRLLQFIGSSEYARQQIQRKFIGASCTDHVEYEVVGEWTIEELVVVQSLDHRTEEAMNPMNRKVFNVGTYKSMVNSTARLVGHQIADPRDSRAVFHSWHLEPTASNIDAFDLTPDDMEELAVFQPSAGQTPLEKCKEIAADLETNVTQIYGRPMLHVAYDLVWHSVIDFRLLGKRMDKGWLDAIVIGDTRTGKSETASRLCEHYNAGIVKSCEGATFAGLVGGAQPSPQGKGWMVTWGTIPLNDRRLVVLDELSGLMKAGGESKGIIEQMSTIRSSGKAQLIKIVSEETSARTRLLWISNPVDGSRLADQPGGGMEAIRKLVVNPEDIARFDFALAVSNADVPSSLINSMKHERVEHIYDADISSKLVMWAWSRKIDQIKFSPAAERKLIEAAEDMGARYIAEPPLIQIENIRMKLARIAVSIAARTFSTITGENINVNVRHIEAAVEFLDWVYSAEVMGYQRHSRRIQINREDALLNIPKVVEFLRKRSGTLGALRAVMYDESFRTRDFEEYGGGGGEGESKEIVALLLQWHMARRLTRGQGRLVLEPPMIMALKQLEAEGV